MNWAPEDITKVSNFRKTSENSLLRGGNSRTIPHMDIAMEMFKRMSPEEQKQAVEGLKILEKYGELPPNAAQEYEAILSQFDPNNPTHFLVDLATSGMYMLADLSSRPKASDRLKQDAKVIFEWLGQDIGPLTPTSCEKLKTGILGYASIGVAPSPALQRIFNMLQVKEGFYPRPPAEVRDVFDRMFTSQEEIAEERIAETRKRDAIMQNLQRIYNGDFPCSDDLPKKSISDRLLARVHQLSDFTKLFLVVTAVWVLWVWIRTDTEFQLVGYYFRQWHSDMVLPNLLLVPVLLLVGKYVYKLYVRKYRTTEERR